MTPPWDVVGKGMRLGLTEIGKELGYTVQVVPPLKDEAGIISSTRIRAAIAAGNVSCRRLRSGPIVIPSPVRLSTETGVGIPLTSPRQISKSLRARSCLPYGIYACRAWVDGQSLPGRNQHRCPPDLLRSKIRPLQPSKPTCSISTVTCMGRKCQLEFVEYLRPEEKYPSIQALMEQIQKDISQTRKILGI